MFSIDVLCHLFAKLTHWEHFLPAVSPPDMAFLLSLFFSATACVFIILLPVLTRWSAKCLEYNSVVNVMSKVGNHNRLGPTLLNGTSLWRIWLLWSHIVVFLPTDTAVCLPLHPCVIDGKCVFLVSWYDWQLVVRKCSFFLSWFCVQWEHSLSSLGSQVCPWLRPSSIFTESVPG